MKTLGYIKKNIIIETFVNIIYEENGSNYVSITSNGTYRDFKKVVIPERWIIEPLKEKIDVCIGDNEIICFIWRDIEIHGKKKDILDKLMYILNNEFTSFGAKCEIAAELFLNKLVEEYFHKYFTELNKGNGFFNGKINMFFDLHEIKDVNLIDWDVVITDIKKYASDLNYSFYHFTLFLNDVVYFYKYQINIDQCVEILASLENEKNHLILYNTIIDNVNEGNMPYYIFEKYPHLYKNQLSPNKEVRSISEKKIREQRYGNRGIDNFNIETKNLTLFDDFELENRVAQNNNRVPVKSISMLNKEDSYKNILRISQDVLNNHLTLNAVSE